MKIRSEGTELYHAERQIGTNDEATSRSSQLRDSAW
jgi:hypothetical protein